MTSKNLFFAAIRLNGLEKVVMTHKTIATVIDTGCISRHQSLHKILDKMLLKQLLRIIPAFNPFGIFSTNNFTPAC